MTDKSNWVEPEVPRSVVDQIVDDLNESEDGPVRWEDQNFDPPSFITLARIYDVISWIALKMDDTEGIPRADEILDMHEAGNLFNSEPRFAIGDDGE